MLYKEYEPEVLKKLQRAEVEILKDFDELCQKHGIDYFVCGGTAIGGVRHQGFIPWDDDIDLGMTREHYEHFLEVAEQEYGEKYKIVNADTNPDFPVTLTKWYRTGTVFRNEEMINLDLHIGIAIDIFCFDNVADELPKFRRQAMRALDLGKADGSASGGESHYLCGWVESKDYASGGKAGTLGLKGAALFTAVFVQKGNEGGHAVQRCTYEKGGVSL